MNLSAKQILYLVIAIIVLLAIWFGIKGLDNLIGPAGSETINEDAENAEDTEKTTIQVYFGNSEMSSGEDCSEVFPVERKIAETEAVANAALSELFKGPTSREKEEGYFTNLPEGVAINDLRVEEGGTAYADFNEVLNQGGGSCMMIAREAQITETLKQFPTVDGVIISVNGDAENVLQP